MTNQEISVVLGFFLPILVAFIKREHFPNAWNAIIAIAVYIVFGVAAVVFSGQPFVLDNIIPSVGIFTAAGTVGYAAFWKNFETVTG